MSDQFEQSGLVATLRQMQGWKREDAKWLKITEVLDDLSREVVSGTPEPKVLESAHKTLIRLGPRRISSGAGRELEQSEHVADAATLQLVNRIIHEIEPADESAPPAGSA